MIPVHHILGLSAILFAIGVGGVILRRNAIIVFLSVELMLNAVNVGFVGVAYGLESLAGVFFVFFVLIVAAAEAVIGLAIMLEIFRNRQTLELENFNLLRW